MWCWRPMGKIKGINRISNEEVLSTYVITKANWVGPIWQRESLLHDVDRGKIKELGRKGMQVINK